MYQKEKLSVEMNKLGEHLAVGSYESEEHGEDGTAYIWKTGDEALVTLMPENDGELTRKSLRSQPSYHDPSHKWAYAEKALCSTSEEPELPQHQEDFRAYVETALRHNEEAEEELQDTVVL